MPKINERKTGTHILAFLTENKGIGMRYTDVHRAMIAKGYHHNNTSIATNLRFLLEHKKVVKVLTCYGIPNVRNDGSKYLTILSLGQKITVNIE